jgi:small subunit ribosomal protein S7
MPRKGPVEPKRAAPDAVFGSRVVGKFINCLMMDGKKSIAERVFYGSLQLAAERTGEDPLNVLERALRNVIPVLEVRPRRVGGATYQVPVEVRPSRKLTLAIRWLIDASRARKGRPMAEKLAAELIDAANRTGAAVKKREDTHRMAEANRAFAHYRW